MPVDYFYDGMIQAFQAVEHQLVAFAQISAQPIEHEGVGIQNLSVGWGKFNKRSIHSCHLCLSGG